MKIKTLFDNFNQQKIIKYTIYNQYNTEVKQLEVQTSSNIYKKFSEILNCEIEELAIFYKQELVKKKDEFKKYGYNEEIYQIYSIFTMKVQLDIYEKIIPDMHNNLKHLEQEKKYLKESLHDSLLKLSKFQESEQQLYLSTLESQFDTLQNNIRNSLYQTKFEEILYICQNCQMQIYGTNIQTTCQHNYHQKCFEELMEKQSYDTKISCLCGIKLSLKILQNLSNEDKIKQIQKLIFSNQLKILKEKLENKYEVGEYNDEDCSFFYVIKNKSQIEQ